MSKPRYTKEDLKAFTMAAMQAYASNNEILLRGTQYVAMTCVALAKVTLEELYNDELFSGENSNVELPIMDEVGLEGLTK